MMQFVVLYNRHHNHYGIGNQAKSLFAHASIYAASGPSGFIAINNFGSSINAPSNADSMAAPVSKPKYMLGLKLDSTKIEKPKIIITEV